MRQSLGNYQILSTLHREPIGTVHLGRHQVLEQDVRILVVDEALSAFLPFRKKFLWEMRSVGRLRHTNIARILDVGVDLDTIYVAVEMEPGNRSSQVLADAGKMPPSTGLRVGAGVTSALIHAHLKGILHRHLHPGNVWIRPDGSPVVHGFGFAAPHDLPGLPPAEFDAPDGIDVRAFLAPEILEGRPGDAKSDLWSVGALVFFLVTGRPPFAGTDVEERLGAIGRGRLDLPGDVARLLPAKGVALLARILARAPEVRPDSLYAVKAEFEGLAADGGVTRLVAETPGRMEAGTRFEPSGGLSSYQIIEKRGQGGFGAVYKVKDTRNDRVFAMKILKADAEEGPKLAARFRREWEVLRAVDHPNIVKVIEVGSDGDVLYYVMDYVDGPDLREVVQKMGGLPYEQAIQIAAAIARGLEAAHAAGVVHRDLTPANVLVDPTGRVVLTDFGLAYIPGETKLTRTGDMFGTPRYMAPEVIAGHPADRRSDLYGLGAILYEMLAGKPPFIDDSVWALFRRIVNEDPPLAEDFPKSVPTPVRAVVHRLLEKDPAGRFRNATELLSELARIEEEEDELDQGAKTPDGSET
ncbi:MAG: serine/threonine protein kinase [Planctomycetes bacterium]|nr:serine/threonine protein kinase [Planctomycetota bacterium]